MPDSVLASAVSPQPVRWLWREHIPVGMLSVIAGRPNKGKSLLAFHVAADISRAGGMVLLSTAEDPLRQVARPRIEAAGGDLDRVRFLRRPSLPEDVEWLGREIREYDAQLVILDPIAAHLTVSINNDQETRRALTPVSDLAEETGCAFLAVAHTIKYFTRRADPLGAIGGSSGGLTGACRTAYLLAPGKEDEDERILAQLKCNVAGDRPSLRFELDMHGFENEIEAGFLNFRGTCSDRAAELLDGEGPTGPKPQKREKAAEWMIGYLRCGPMLVRDLIEDGRQKSFSEKTLRRAAVDVGVLKPKGGPKSKWSLPADLLAELASEEAEDDE